MDGNNRMNNLKSGDGSMMHMRKYCLLNWNQKRNEEIKRIYYLFNNIINNYIYILH